MALALTVICFVCAALLGLVYGVTKAPIDQAALAKETAAIAAVTPEFDNLPSSEPSQELGDAKVYFAKKAGRIVGYALKVKTSGFGGALEMMVGFTPDGNIYNTSILSHSETPGLGAKLADTQAAPRAQIVGKNPSRNRIAVRKDGGEIDAITASTITSRAFLKGVNTAYDAFMKINQAQAANTESDE